MSALLVAMLINADLPPPSTDLPTPAVETSRRISRSLFWQVGAAGTGALVLGVGCSLFSAIQQANAPMGFTQAQASDLVHQQGTLNDLAGFFYVAGAVITAATVLLVHFVDWNT